MPPRSQTIARMAIGRAFDRSSETYMVLKYCGFYILKFWRMAQELRVTVLQLSAARGPICIHTAAMEKGHLAEHHFTAM